MLPLPNNARSDRRPYAFSAIPKRSSRSWRLLLAALLAISALAWFAQSLHINPFLRHAPPVDAYEQHVIDAHSEVADSSPAKLPPEAPPEASRDIRAFLSFVTQFPDRALPPNIAADDVDVYTALEEDAAAAGLQAWEEVPDLPLVVFSKTYCPFSRRAKDLLASLHLNPTAVVVEADLRSDTSTLKALLSRLTHHSTFPNVFIGGVSVGGSDDLAKLHANGELVTLLKNAGVEVYVKEQT